MAITIQTFCNLLHVDKGAELNLPLVENKLLYASLKQNPGARANTREAKREIEDCFKKLVWVESDFIAAIFNNEITWTYQEAFEKFNASFYNTAKKLRYKWIDIDVHYFFNKYKPAI